MVYCKNYSLYDMKDRDIENLERGISLLGFQGNSYKIMRFSDSGVELKVLDKKLHRLLKSISKLQRLKNKH